MRYNGLPTYYQVESNSSRYQFITANFYGDPNWKSMYGVNGVDRAFAYNGEYFYKIIANPDADNDKPRHIANHHSHLALGYAEGRVDVSVVGEPYNFDGAKGASSWAFGDSVTGLLPLSGTMLGIFCQKSVWGLSGTTVDNFTSQVISPRMGAIEYTVTDMGFPVYANVYGIYTLSQTTEYGDYKGTPLSQDVSPWLRDRLQRDGTSDKEVVVAWPVRAKNQYKLAFADGYVLTMTMNFGSQQAPTFSKQKYFYTHPDFEAVEVDLYAQPSIVPAAISSELDHTGEERIHVAPKIIEREEEYYSTGGGGSDPETKDIWVTMLNDGPVLLPEGVASQLDLTQPIVVEAPNGTYEWRPYTFVGMSLWSFPTAVAGTPVKITQGDIEIQGTVRVAPYVRIWWDYRPGGRQKVAVANFTEPPGFYPGDAFFLLYRGVIREPIWSDGYASYTLEPKVIGVEEEAAMGTFMFNGGQLPCVVWAYLPSDG